MLSTDQCQYLRSSPAVGVEERDGVQLNPIGCRIVREQNVESVQVGIAMRKHDALGIGTRAAGIEKFGHAVFVHFHDVCAVRGSSSEHVVVIGGSEPIGLGRAVEKAEMFNRGNALPKGIHRGKKLFLQEKYFCPCVVQNERELVRGQADVEG